MRGCQLISSLRLHPGGSTCWPAIVFFDAKHGGWWRNIVELTWIHYEVCEGLGFVSTWCIRMYTIQMVQESSFWICLLPNAVQSLCSHLCWWSSRKWYFDSANFSAGFPCFPIEVDISPGMSLRILHDYIWLNGRDDHSRLSRRILIEINCYISWSATPR